MIQYYLFVMSSLSIPDTLFRTLKSAFESEQKRLCRDAAKLLRVPEDQVKSMVAKAMTPITFTVYDEDEKRQTCAVFVQKAVVLERCRGPCLMGTGRCLHHQSVKDLPELPDTIESLTRVERADPNDPPMWCNESTHVVYNSEGKVVGNYEDGALTLFTFTEEDE
jgi:hypothetical protein